MKITFYAFILLGLSACAAFQPEQWVWSKAGFTQQEFASDNYQCLQEAQQPYSYADTDYHGANPALAPYWDAQAAQGGYRPPLPTVVQRSGVKTNQGLYNACMNGRGYSWINIAPARQG